MNSYLSLNALQLHRSRLGRARGQKLLGSRDRQHLIGEVDLVGVRQRRELDGQGSVRGAVKSIKGEYVLERSTKGTKVTYRTTMELAISLPGLMKLQAEKTIINTALGGLKKRFRAADATPSRRDAGPSATVMSRPVRRRARFQGAAGWITSRSPSRTWTEASPGTEDCSMRGACPQGAKGRPVPNSCPWRTASSSGSSFTTGPNRRIDSTRVASVSITSRGGWAAVMSWKRGCAARKSSALRTRESWQHQMGSTST